MTDQWPSRAFGVELEMSDYHEPDELLDAVTDAVQAAAARAKVPASKVAAWNSEEPAWVIKDDGSCGTEITSPPMTWTRGHELQAVCQYLQSTHQRVGRDCGLHVHHDFRGAKESQLRNVMLGWAVFEPVMNLMVSNSRIGNDYCHQLPSFARLQKVIVEGAGVEAFYQLNGRYYGLNAGSWWRLGTIEIRLHHGTLQFRTICTWVLTTQVLLDWWSGPDWTTREMTRFSTATLAERARAVLERVKANTPAAARVLDGLQYRMRRWHSAIYDDNKLETIYATL